jgi:septal ring factor EnvC (AmiA/AmiB activator)
MNKLLQLSQIRQQTTKLSSLKEQIEQFEQQLSEIDSLQARNTQLNQKLQKELKETKQLLKFINSDLCESEKQKNCLNQEKKKLCEKLRVLYDQSEPILIDLDKKRKEHNLEPIESIGKQKEREMREILEEKRTLKRIRFVFKE